MSKEYISDSKIHDYMVSLNHIKYQCKSIEAVLYQHLKSWFPELAFMRRVELSYEELDELIRAERRRFIDRVLKDYLNEIYPDGPDFYPKYTEEVAEGF
jgi:hypothetical protein